MENEINVDSILESVKKVLGIYKDDTSFDQDIIFHINTNFLTLSQLGIGLYNPDFYVKSAEDKWTDYIPASPTLEMVKEYLYLQVRLAFDPPTSTSVMESMKNRINELECRLNYQYEEDRRYGKIQ